MEVLEDLADLLYDIPREFALVFDIVHYIVCLQGERADLGEDFENVTKLNPLVKENCATSPAMLPLSLQKIAYRPPGSLP